MSVKYTDPESVVEVKVTEFPRSGQTASGYGRKIPTRHMVKVGTRWHRVYVMCYGNAGSAYIVKGGETLFLDTDTEHRLYAQ